MDKTLHQSIGIKLHLLTKIWQATFLYNFLLRIKYNELDFKLSQIPSEFF